MTFISQIQVDQMCLCSLTYFAYYIIPGVLVLGVVQFDGMEIYAVITVVLTVMLKIVFTF